MSGNTQHSQESDVLAPGGIRTCRRSKQEAADLRLRPRGHRDLQFPYYGEIIKPFDSRHALESRWEVPHLNFPGDRVFLAVF